jgi:Methyltransferase domain
MDAAEKIRDLDFIFHRRLTRRWWRYVRKYGCRRIFELGVYKGRNFHRMIQYPCELAVAVDAWAVDGSIATNDTFLTQAQKEAQYENFKAEMADKPFVMICRGYTHDVVKQFPDDYFDLGYVDADHSHEGCLRDLRDWWPKMRVGGAFTGDDYLQEVTPRGVEFGVISALEVFCKEQGVVVTPLPWNGWVIIK